MKRLRAGVIGLGVGGEHAAGYQRHQACEVTALCDLSDGKLARAKAEFPNARLTCRPEDILGDPLIDLVSIASYDDAHFEQTLAALRAGKHVFVEKPMCRSQDELARLKQAWLRQGHPKLASNLVLRAVPLYQWLRREIRNGRLGQVYAFDGDYLYGRLEKIARGWRKDVENYSVVQGGGIHLIDLMLWLTNEKPTTVAAVGNRLCTAETDFRYDDYVTATFRFASGLIGRITANFGCVHRHQHVVRVFGTRATFIYDDQGPRLHTDRAPSIPPRPLDLPALPASKSDLIPSFVDAIANGQDTRAETQHEFDVISTCSAADRALTTGHTTEVEYL